MQLNISYDKISDTLYLDLAAPSQGQDSRSIADGVLARVDPETGALGSLEIVDFQARFGERKTLDLPLVGNLILGDFKPPVLTKKDAA